MTLAEALKELGDDRRYVEEWESYFTSAGYILFTCSPSWLAQAVQITQEGIALPNGQLLYRFADKDGDSR